MVKLNADEGISKYGSFVQTWIASDSAKHHNINETDMGLEKVILAIFHLKLSW